MAAKPDLLDAFSTQEIVGYVNDYKLQVVKIDSAFVWHTHNDTDDLFLVVRGRHTIRLRDRNVDSMRGLTAIAARTVPRMSTSSRVS